MPEHDYAALADAFSALDAAATDGPWTTISERYDQSGRALCGPDGMEVVTKYLGPICSVGDPYPRGDNRPQENMELIAWCGTNRAAVLAALRIAHTVAELRADNCLTRSGLALMRENADSLTRGDASLDPITAACNLGVCVAALRDLFGYPHEESFEEADALWRAERAEVRERGLAPAEEA